VKVTRKDQHVGLSLKPSWLAYEELDCIPIY